jgi:ribosomal protein S18 acetylase RimI-like enzyme
VTIRAATEADLSRIHAIRMGVTENVLSDPSKVSAAEVAWYLEQAIFLVSEAGGEVAGFACANHQSGYVWALFVDPAHERRGHGRALLDALTARLTALGQRQSFLTTGAGTRAEGFYRAAGWRDMGRSLGGEIVFVKAL